MIRRLKRQYKKYAYKYSDYVESSDESIKLYWWHERKNVGDALNYDLAKFISKNMEVERVPYSYKKDFFMAVGSVIQHANKNTTIWGSGLISDTALPIFPPKEILAVRGPLTRKLLLGAGLSCPEIYGDPALLTPSYINAKYDTSFKLGIVPHFIDKQSDFFTKELPDWVRVIDVETDDVEAFVNEISSCSLIVTSSLHGIILSDAYGIPSARISFSNKVVGGDFKFADYSATVGRNHFTATSVTRETTVESLLKLNFECAKNIDTDRMLEVNPFIG